MINKKFCFSVVAAFIIVQTFAQSENNSIYSFINLPIVSRTSALGGYAFAINDNDNAIAYYNPSLLNKEMDKMLTMSYVDYFGDIKSSSAIFSKSLNTLGNYNFGVHYINYGEFNETDITGEKQGTFTANDYAITIGWGRQVAKNLAIGANLKNIVSQSPYSKSWGLATDIASSYSSEDKKTTIALLIKNAGKQITRYNQSEEPLPFEIQLGFSKRLQHVPLRYILTYTHIEKFDITYAEETENEALGFDTEPAEKKKSKIEDIAEKTMQHIVIGAEFEPSKNLAFRLGYNYKRRQDLKVESKLALVGFSGGLELRISKFRFGYSRASYHLAGALNQFTISTNFSEFAKKSDIL